MSVFYLFSSYKNLLNNIKMKFIFCSSVWLNYDTIDPITVALCLGDNTTTKSPLI